MDYTVMKELAALKAEKNSSQDELEAHKYTLQHQLNSGMCEQMMEQLQNPPKPSVVTGLKYRFARWKTIRDNNRREREERRKTKKGDQ